MLTATLYYSDGVHEASLHIDAPSHYDVAASAASAIIQGMPMYSAGRWVVPMTPLQRGKVQLVAIREGTEKRGFVSFCWQYDGPHVIVQDMIDVKAERRSVE